MFTISQVTLTVEFILTECTNPGLLRHEYCKENDIKKLFENFEINKIISDLQAQYIYIYIYI